MALRRLPSVGVLLEEPEYRALTRRFSHHLVARAIATVIDTERARVLAGEDAYQAQQRSGQVKGLLEAWLGTKGVALINATGVLLHTNLGRAPLAATAASSAAKLSTSYSSLEYDLASGRRGDRGLGVAELLRLLTGSASALVVNNNAGATLLILTALAQGRQVIISRGQLVEIGGSFRLPDVMRLSRAKMVEVGTTNRTRIDDYEQVIGPRTAALMRVHTSNYRITGFVESASIEAMANLAHSCGVLLIDDLGSGLLRPSDIAALDAEPDVETSLKAGSDVICFSGDKLLGGPQAGIILGRADLIAKLARHPLARALRVDKMTLAALDETVRLHLTNRLDEIPLWHALLLDADHLHARVTQWQAHLAAQGIASAVITEQSLVGGGSAPQRGLTSWLLAIGDRRQAPGLLRRLRLATPAVVGRVAGGVACLDPRTVLDDQDKPLLQAVADVMRKT